MNDAAWIRLLCVSAAAVWCLPVLGACRAPATRAAEEFIGDRVSVEDLPTWILREELRIGADGNTAPNDPQAIAIGNDGTIYVLDSFERQVLAFDTLGAQVRRIGRRGSGPGELEFPSRLGVLGDTIWVVEDRRHRTTLYSTSADVIAVISTSASVAVSEDEVPQILARPGELRADGTFEPEYIWQAGVAYGDSVHVRRTRFDSRGFPLESNRREWVYPAPRIAVQSGRSGRTDPGRGIQVTPRFVVSDRLMSHPLVFGADSLRFVVHRPAPVEATRGTFSLSRVDSLGRVDILKHYEFQAAPLDELGTRMIRLEDGGFATCLPLIGGATRQNLDEARRAVGAAFELPAYLPGIIGGIMADDHSLWLRRHDDCDDHLRWTVLGFDGIPIAEVRTSRRIDIRVVGSERVWGVATDAMRVSHVVRYRIDRGRTDDG